MSIRLAFGGAAQAGKDLAAAHLLSKHPGELLKFADIMHAAARPLFEILGFTYEKDRKFLQYLGTDWARAKDKNVFVRPVISAILADPAKNYLLTDVRFPNEADALLNQDFVLVKIERKDLPEPDAEWRKHESERALDRFTGWHYRIKNCGTLNHYLEQIDMLWRFVESGEHKKNNFQTLTIE